MWNRAQSAADEDRKATLDFAVHFAGACQQSQIVDADQPAGVLFAAGESGLEFASEVLRIGMPKQEVCHRFCVGSYVERFIVADTCKRASRDVAHRIAASFLCRDADGGEAAHQIGSIFDVDEMKLEVLSGGDMQNAVRIFVGE